jgi:hypothetical protein
MWMDFRLAAQEKDASKGESERSLSILAFSDEAKAVPSSLSFLPSCFRETRMATRLVPLHERVRDLLTHFKKLTA